MGFWKKDNAQHRVPTLTITVLGTALSIAGWAIISSLEDRTSAAEFNSRASNMAAALQNGVNEGFTKIFALRAFFETSRDSVGEQDFLTFSDRLLQDQSVILSLSWIPRIRDEDRAAHERAAQHMGLDGYRIRSVSEDGALNPSPRAAEYFPVYYTTEKARADFVHGLNLGDTGFRKQPLENARDSNALAASQAFTLQSGVGNRFGFFVVLPVYQQGQPHDSVEDRRRNLIGFIQGVFQIDTVIAAALQGIYLTSDFSVFSSGPEAEAPQRVYSQSAKPPDVLPAVDQTHELDTASHWSGRIAIADRYWWMLAAPRQESKLAHPSAWILLTAGLCLTGVVFVSNWRSERQTRKLVEANQTISELAHRDPLTGVANHRAFRHRLAAAFDDAKQGGEPFAMLYIDLDHFRDFNDLMGHPAGDALLGQVSERLRAAASEADCVARFGGDEFAILQRNAPTEDSGEELGEKILAALKELSVVDGQPARISASIGVSRYADELDGPDTMLMQADLALYRAKDAGRNRVCVHDKAFDQEACERVILGRELMAAIKGGGLTLQYQPQVDIDSGRIVGLEALVRWNHPERGPISPAQFVPIAEKTGSIVELGKWVFDEACRQTRVWQDDGIDPLSVAINISAIQCKQAELEHDIIASLTRWNIAPGLIELELTESVLMEATQHHRDIIARLRALGLRLAIDDFGTGYSSLNYLTNFPVDRIKIAQELIFKCTTDIRHATVVRAAIHLAKELDTGLLAEGVEAVEQARFLSTAGCKLAQGYFFSRPIDAAQATALLRAGFIRPTIAPVNATTASSPGRGRMK
jgi:diguanylate cyclase (GGDEF)-like protein